MPECFSDSLLLSSASPWNRYFYLGGPGGNAPGCYQGHQCRSGP